MMQEGKGETLLKHTRKKSVTDESGKLDLLECSYEYPQILTNKEDSPQAKVNEDITRVMDQRYQSNCEEALVSALYIVDLISIPNDGLIGPSWFPLKASVTYRVTFNQHGILSIVFLEFRWYGGAHPSTEQFSMTYNVETGKQITAPEILGESEDEVKKQIASGFTKHFEQDPDKFFPDAIKDLAKLKFQYRFYLMGDNIVFYFNPYEIGPFASGILEYSMPILKKK
jgi:hypothetical protein